MSTAKTERQKRQAKKLLARMGTVERFEADPTRTPKQKKMFRRIIKELKRIAREGWITQVKGKTIYVQRDQG